MRTYLVLGAGPIGRATASSLVRRGHTVKVGTRSGTAVEGAQALTLDATDTAALTAAATGCDAVVICTPTDTHADLIERFSRAGKAIFCEKPVDLDLKRARECEEIVKASGKACLIGFQRRFDPTFAALKARIEAGEIGQLEAIGIPYTADKRMIEKLQAVTAPQVQAVAAKYLIDDRLTVAELDPQPLPNTTRRPAAALPVGSPRRIPGFHRQRQSRRRLAV